MGGRPQVSTVAASASPSTELIILRELLAREPGFMSGATLAAQLGLSRVAVWQHMEKLRAPGYLDRVREWRFRTRLQAPPCVAWLR